MGVNDHRPATRVVNIRLKPWRDDPQSYVYVGRAGRGQTGYFGNPFRERTPDNLDRFREHFLRRVANDPEFRSDVLSLRSKNLGCFCVNSKGEGKCHAKIMAEWIDAQPQA